MFDYSLIVESALNKLMYSGDQTAENWLKQMIYRQNTLTVYTTIVNNFVNLGFPPEAALTGLSSDPHRTHNLFVIASECARNVLIAGLSSCEGKLMYGMLFSIKSFVAKISPLDPKEGFLNYRTTKYTLHCFETPSGLKFIMNTDNQAQGVRDLLKKLYSEVYVKYVVRNPMCAIDEPITSEIFKTKLDAFVKQTSIFAVRAT